MTKEIDPSSDARWQKSLVTGIIPRTPRIKSFLVSPSEPFPFQAGQHVDLRRVPGDAQLLDRILAGR